jgi:hypothetical protein
MKLIAHRGNLDGPNPLLENSLEYIDHAIECGYDVEVDVRVDKKTKSLFLGHDEPQYQVSWIWFGQRINNLWIHCKDLQALYEFSRTTSGFNYFWHQNDDFTLTSKGHIWTYPGKAYTPNSVLVMPEMNLSLDILYSLTSFSCYGICSDFVEKFK